MEDKQKLELVKKLMTFPYKGKGLSQIENTVACLYTFGLTIEEIYLRYKDSQTISTIEDHLNNACWKLNIYKDDLTKEWRSLLLKALYPYPKEEL